MNDLDDTLTNIVFKCAGGISNMGREEVALIKQAYAEAGYKATAAHKEFLNGHKLQTLKLCATYVMSTMSNDFKKSEVPGLKDNSLYANFQKLRYHGLITQVRIPGTDKRYRDRWLITRNGWAFMRGTTQLPKYVIIKDNSIQSRSDELVDYSRVSLDGAYVATQFEYFNDDNEPVGLRPALPVHPPEQVKLI